MKYDKQISQVDRIMGRYQIKNITAYGECGAFVKGFIADKTFSDPMLSNDKQIANNLIKAIEDREKFVVIGIFDNTEMVGLFSFLVLKDERYIEMLVGLSREKEVYEVMFDYLKKHFNGYNADFVFNPNNYLLYNCLKERGAEFETEQQKMVYSKLCLDVDTSEVVLLTEPYKSSYIEMHDGDTYWTGEKVIEAADRFRAFVVIENGVAVGYLDVTYCFEENEPYDLFVKEEYRGKGYGRKLLAKALEMNRPNEMTALVDVDDEPVIRLFKSVGFLKVENNNSLSAHLNIIRNS